MDVIEGRAVRQRALQDVPREEIVTEVCLFNIVFLLVKLEGNQS